MTRGLTISVDGMGGDHGPETVIGGIDIASVRHPDVRFLVYGDEEKLKAVMERFPRVASVSEIHHCDVSISMDDKPSQALRRGRKVSSMWQAIDAVKEGQAQAVVSAGNTGALMAMSMFILKTLAHVERPAISALWPTTRGESVVLDVGATIGPDAKQLVQFAAMGEAYARVIFNVDKPTVGLLNIGEEEVKGTEQVKAAAQMLRESDLPIVFKGFVEGDDLGKGTVDVVVTDGFTGNIALKTAEGTARQISEYLRAAISRSLMAKIGYFFAQGAFKALSTRLDPRANNGGLFLGLNGLVVKSHGGTDALGFAAAIDVAVDVASADLLNKIVTDLGHLDGLEQLASGRNGGKQDTQESEAALP
ncbi:phosphate acyltransferase PlsX [Parvibaculum sp.]|uniref:phosphate acyltransferase PlsX n=1 Tax=Parvibaculum sp. TaxID=2024848 RepID=UPI000C92910D|nr:phosphate acyltransferase PlsX [Parvibaculum sp.]MAB13796.1 phosphate acyltransferase [Parvibaculum sp.]